MKRRTAIAGRKKLVLSRETLRALGLIEMAHVAGGNSSQEAVTKSDGPGCTGDCSQVV